MSKIPLKLFLDIASSYAKDNVTGVVRGWFRGRWYCKAAWAAALVNLWSRDWLFRPSRDFWGEIEKIMRGIHKKEYLMVGRNDNQKLK